MGETLHLKNIAVYPRASNDSIFEREKWQRSVSNSLRRLGPGIQPVPNNRGAVCTQ